MSELKKLASGLGETLQRRGWMVATAESCTGGWIAKCITDIAGSSAWFDRGFVCYSNAAKQEMLGVDAAMLDAEGAVSEATAVAMVHGALKHCPADIAVAVSGIAGPGGGSPDKPVGTVCFAWATRDGLLRAATVLFEGNRETVRQRAVVHALEGLLDAGKA
ncbi:MAG: nicotinamide-nucleotide amidase [Gammaproteobacteria bacterium]|nr:MAG: nicotinamide-nucleotide amidase [Gammaproteobacteria bacterium]